MGAPCHGASWGGWKFEGVPLIVRGDGRHVSWRFKGGLNISCNVVWGVGRDGDEAGMEMKGGVGDGRQARDGKRSGAVKGGMNLFVEKC